MVTVLFFILAVLSFFFSFFLFSFSYKVVVILLECECEIDKDGSSTTYILHQFVRINFFLKCQYILPYIIAKTC